MDERVGERMGGQVYERVVSEHYVEIRVGEGSKDGELKIQRIEERKCGVYIKRGILTTHISA